MKSLFHVTISDKGHNLRGKEEQTYMFFCVFMDECEGTSMCYCSVFISLGKEVDWAEGYTNI